MSTLNRRDFTKQSTLAGVAGVTSALSAGRVLGANDKVRIGFIGLGNRGDQVLDGFLAHKDCEIAAICDIYQPYLDFASKKIGTQPTQYRDYRKLLDQKNLDAVVICTPDHWHALQTVDACRAGKDVYVEKPLSLCIAEGRTMVEAARKYKRVTQVGIHRRSASICKQAAEFIQAGGIGKVTAVRAFHIQNEWPLGIGKPADGPPPEGFDWEAWVGPAPMKPFNKNRSFYRFRWFYDYSGGQVTNFGVHYLDVIHWALGVEAPKAVVALGGKFANFDNREVPDTLEVVWHYPGDTLVTFSQFNATAAVAAAKPCEVEFRGTQGTLYLMGRSFEVVPDNITPNEFVARDPRDRTLEKGYRVGAKTQIAPKKVETEGIDPTKEHARDFLDCVKSRKLCRCDIEIGHRSTSTTLLANMAHRLKSYLEWDAKAERCVNNEAANKMLSYAYRAPYKLEV